MLLKGQERREGRNIQKNEELRGNAFEGTGEEGREEHSKE
jgi:hypothetical protein